MVYSVGGNKMWDKILTGLCAGAVYSASAFFKKTTVENFDVVKFLTSVSIGTVAGILTTLLEMDMTTAENFLVTLGIVPLVENGFKILWRKLIKKE